MKSPDLFDPPPYFAGGDDRGMKEASPEHHRLAACSAPASDGSPQDWKRWGPYLSERQWGTCREDYSDHGNSWIYLPFEHAHQVAYRWGEDGIAGWSDREQLLCVSTAVWNGQDPILKERLFGLTNPQGNHGEDVKELYYYLDATPTHSYLKMLYKYPQAPFPYDELRREAFERKGDPHQGEYELLDTGIFDDDRYFDVYTEYARGDAEETLVRVTAHNRGPEAAELHLLPQLWFRDTWSRSGREEERPRMTRSPGSRHIVIQHPSLGCHHLHLDGEPEVLFCENVTHDEALNSAGALSPFREPEPTDRGADAKTDPAEEGCGREGAAGAPEPKASGAEEDCPAAAEAPAAPPPPGVSLPHHVSGCSQGPFKDGFHSYVVARDRGAVATTGGTKAGLLTRHTIPPGGSVQVRFRIAPADRTPEGSAFDDFDAVFESRKSDADKFYSVIQAAIGDPERRRIHRQALAGMIWTKQFYHYDIRTWLEGDPGRPEPGARGGRNSSWCHLYNADIISMPDKWEYPWYATWDLAFHCLPLALVDAAFAKEQLKLMTGESFMHPNGQLPAYEWNFSDANPPVHAWAVWRVFQMDRAQRRDGGDLCFLEELFHKLMLNFNWWVNCKDAEGKHIFQGGFLGLDNISVVDRSQPLPDGSFINQSDGTGWMAFYSLTLMRISLELASRSPAYESIACKFLEHFFRIGRAMAAPAGAGGGLWDTDDEFYYDVLASPDGERKPIRLRSLVGIIPLFAVEVIEPAALEKFPAFAARLQGLCGAHPDFAQLVSRHSEPGAGERWLLSVLPGDRLRSLLKRMLDPAEFLSDFGVRGLSRHHLKHPYVFEFDGAASQLSYDPAEATVVIMGGNSNWRGPVWFPINYLVIESLQKFSAYHGDQLLVEYPSGSGQQVPLLEVANSLCDRLVSLFECSEDGRRPSMQMHQKLASGHFRDNLLFYEYFHGDTGRGIGASHQTGWTGLVAKLIQIRSDNR